MHIPAVSVIECAVSLLKRPLHPDMHSYVVLFYGYPIIRSYFGGGSKIHALLQMDSGRWQAACCFYDPWYAGTDFEEEYEREDYHNRLISPDDSTQPNCLRCLKRLGVIAGYPGSQNRRQPHICHPNESVTSLLAQLHYAKNMLLRLGVNLDEVQDIDGPA